jgi:hypothetical protein
MSKYRDVTICEPSLETYTRTLLDYIKKGWEVNYNPLVSPNRTLTGSYIATLQIEEEKLNANETGNSNTTAGEDAAASKPNRGRGNSR